MIPFSMGILKDTGTVEEGVKDSVQYFCRKMYSLLYKFARLLCIDYWSNPLKGLEERGL